ncbi:MAG TPA: thioesterase family protein [Candidatus Gemmiger faecavium]|nr:thioesterase family protein [Candidatus Gemmiger faecavium]
MLKIGITGEARCLVTPETTAANLGSGALEVFATPAMIALIEKAAWQSVQPMLEEGCGTVGTALRVRHLSATAVGMEVVAKTELREIDGRRLVFKVEVRDAKGIVGDGEHERFIVKNDSFLKKAKRKLGE